MIMYLEFVRDREGIPIPHINGRIFIPLAKFIIYLRATPMRRGGRREATTINNIYTHLKLLIDYCVDINMTFDVINYENHVGQLRCSLLSRGVSAASYNVYYRSWRSFYEWCDLEGIIHHVRFPAKVEGVVSIGHSSRRMGQQVSSGFRIEKDPGFESQEIVSDYADQVLNDDQFKLLFDTLYIDDPVYAYIAYMMVTTGMRIGGVLQFPLGANDLNPRWLRYPELKQERKAFQRLTYIPKGRKRTLKCIVLAEALKVLHEEYIISIRRQRLITIAPGEVEGIQACLWVNKNGKKVMNYDVWAAFRRASVKIGIKIKPHFLRHTYATYVVYHYFREKNLKPNLAYAHDIHEQLRIQLGHSNLETTKLYIRTIIRVEMEAWLPFLTPHVKRAVVTHIPSQVLADVTAFFEPSPID